MPYPIPLTYTKSYTNYYAMKHDYTLFKRKGKKVWYFHYYENDIRKSKSTGKTLKFEAEEVAHSFIEKMKNPKKDMTLEEYTQNFFIWEKCLWIKRQHSKGHNFSIDMAKQRRGHLKNFILPKFGKYLLSELNGIQIENWLIHIDRANQTKTIC